MTLQAVNKLRELAAIYERKANRLILHDDNGIMEGIDCQLTAMALRKAASDLSAKNGL